MYSERIQSDSINRQNLFEILEDAAVYPHKPDYIKHIQTHISHVYIAPPYVYKCKKPVDFGFLDYKTLEKRKYFCEREVELNRRLCPGVYLGVVPVSNRDNVVEYAVKMKLLDERFFLHTYIEHNTLSNRHLDRVSDKLLDFYRRQNPGADILKHGEIENIKFNTEENFRQTEAFIDKTIHEEEFRTIKYFTNRYFDLKKWLFKRRISDKRIVDGHGDLHLDHIHVSPSGVCIYDCIEFNDRFRYGDLAADLAFLAMDLNYSNRWKEEHYFVNQMAQKLDDPDLLKIIDFYKCYRAYVKGKVKSLQSNEEEISAEERKQARKKAAGYFNLSLRYALIGSRPVVLIFMGRTGTGKSTLAEQMGKTLNLDYFSSDCIRKNLAGIPLHKRVSESKREKLYSPEMSEQTYRRLFEEAKNRIDLGKSVILDATFKRLSARKYLIKKLNSLDTGYLFIEAQASDKTIISRLESRETSEKISVSDARLEDFEKLDARYEPPEEINSHSILRINTDPDFKNTLQGLYKKLVNRQIGE